MAANSSKRPAHAPIRVATRMLGGLGNQLFQYAAGRALATRLRTRLILDCSATAGAERPFVLDRYLIDADVIRDARGKPHARHLRLPGAWGRRMSDLFHDHIPTTYRIDGHRYKVFGEKQWFTCDPIFDKLSGSIYLDGYWQSFRYFEAVADIIRREIRPAWPLLDTNLAWLARIETTNSVSLHVRRGDYLRHPGSDPLVCARSYYESALQHVSQVLQSPQIFVFSDDMAWCREIFVEPDITFVDTNGPDGAADDLRLMAACRHHIIANSSLSWWGAWLAGHSEQVVIAPRPWQPGMTSDADLLPEDWVKLPRA
jgi:hypothetical protein